MSEASHRVHRSGSDCSLRQGCDTESTLYELQHRRDRRDVYLARLDLLGLEQVEQTYVRLRAALKCEQIVCRQLVEARTGVCGASSCYRRSTSPSRGMLTCGCHLRLQVKLRTQDRAHHAASDRSAPVSFLRSTCSSEGYCKRRCSIHGMSQECSTDSIAPTRTVISGIASEPISALALRCSSSSFCACTRKRDPATVSRKFLSRRSRSCAPSSSSSAATRAE